MRFSANTKKMSVAILLAALAVSVIGAVYFLISSRFLSILLFFFGVLLTSCLNIYKIILLERSVNKAINNELKSVKNHMRVQALLKLFLTGVILVAAVKLPIGDLALFWGAVFGVFTLSIAGYGLKIFNKLD